MTKTEKPAVRRPTPDRTRPRRGSATMFRPEEEDDDELERREERGEEAEEEAESERGERQVKRTVRRTLRDAYRVLDDEMQLGFDFARWLGGGGRRRRGRGGGDLLGVAGAGFRALGQLMELWLDLLGPLLPPSSRRLPPASSARRRRMERDEDELERDLEEVEEEEYEEDIHEVRRSRHLPTGELTLSLDIRSKKPVVVSLHVDRDLEPGVLRVNALRARPSAHTGKLPDIEGTSAEVVDGDHVKVHLRVPDDQPDGRYEASMLAGAGRVRIGVLRVEVHSQ